MRFSRNMLLLAAAWLAGVRLVSAQPPPDPAQLPGWWFVPSVQTAGVSERDLLSRGDSRADGTFLRLTPSLETRYRDALRTFNAAYAFDSETYSSRLESLNDVFARQLGVLTLDARVNERTHVVARGRYLSTRRPEEVIEDTGLLFTRRRTTSYLGEGTVERTLTPRFRSTFGYAFSVEDFGEPTDIRPGASNLLHTARTGLTFQRSPRTAVALEYAGNLLVGEDVLPSGEVGQTFTSHALVLRVTHHISPRVSLALLGGPRLSEALTPTSQSPGVGEREWERLPEVLASLTYRSGTQRFSIAYARAQFRGLGARGFVNTESVEGRVAHLSNSRLRVSLRPGIFRNMQSGVRTVSYRVDAAIGYQFTNWLSLDTAYVFKRQDRPALLDEAAVAAGHVRMRQSVVVGFTLRRPIRMD